MCVGSDSILYVCDGLGRVEVLDLAFGFIYQWGSNGTAPDQFSSSLPDIEVGRNNDIYVMDAGNYRVERYVFRTTPTRRTTLGGLKRRFR
jgi:hypothetical protein